MSLILLITTHILDTSRGAPAGDVPVKLLKLENNDDTWQLISEGKTNENGRISQFELGDNVLTAGTYKLTFMVKEYLETHHKKSFYPFVEIAFDVDKLEHYHIPLLLNGFGYTTYRGS